MFKTAVIATALVQASAVKLEAFDHQTKAINPQMVEAINNMKTTWKAAVPAKFTNATVADVKKLLGTVMPGEEGYYSPEVEKVAFSIEDSAIPEHFDVREQWPQCASVVGRVRDQSNCGSCWAFGSTEALNDRRCIATGDAETILSPTDTLACCSGLHCGLSMGCNGGQPAGAWKWFTKTGVSTGGDYADVGKGTTCKPYTFASCAHHVDPPEGMVACDTLPEYKTPQCTSTCSEEAYGTGYSKDKHFAKSHYSVSAANMQKELMEKGTLSVALTVYEDFETYSSGVYQHVTGKKLGGHAVKMIGWGVENGTPYWLCVNSWNPTWGDGGMFKILRGKDECGIESSVVAGEV